MSSSNSNSNNKKKNKKKNQFLKSILFFKGNANEGGCGCGSGSSGCGRPKLSDVFEPIPIPKTSSSTIQNQNQNQNQNHNHPPNLLHNSSSSSFDINNRNDKDEEEDEDYTCSTTTTTIDDDDDDDDDHDRRGLLVETCTKLKDSIAVVKDSEDPFEDFKQSMKQMILEKQISSDEDLKALLNCFLELNSPFHHDVILRAFTQISNQIVASQSQRRRPSISISQDDHKPSDHH